MVLPTTLPKNDVDPSKQTIRSNAHHVSKAAGDHNGIHVSDNKVHGGLAEGEMYLILKHVEVELRLTTAQKN